MPATPLMATFLRSRLYIWTTSFMLCLVASGNLASFWRHIWQSGGQFTEIQHTYTGNDYPENYPMPPLTEVLMVTEDSVHYPLAGPTAAAEWASNNPHGGGYVHLGEPQRFLCVSMFHQLHCLRYLRQALLTANDPFASIPHAQHCLNYLRQLILCQPDLTLEDPSWRDRGWEPGQRGSTHTCRDWSQVYEAMKKNWQQWKQWQNTTHSAV